MRIALLGNPDGWYCRDLRRAAAAEHEIIALPFSQISAHIPSGVSESTATSCDSQSVLASGKSLGEFDCVLVRTMPPGSLEQVVFRMDALAMLSAAGVSVINPPKAIETAVDKYLALAKLRAVGLPVPETVVCQTAEQAMSAFSELGEDVVIKPLFGAEGRGITRVTDEPLALRAFKMLEQLGAAIYLQRFLPHEGYDIRIFLLGERVFAMRRHNANDWRTNISRGAIAEPFEPDRQMIEMAVTAARATGTLIAGVDLLPVRDGTVHVLEVNAVPGWRALAKAHDTDISALVLEYLAAR